MRNVYLFTEMEDIINHLDLRWSGEEDMGMRWSSATDQGVGRAQWRITQLVNTPVIYAYCASGAPHLGGHLCIANRAPIPASMFIDEHEFYNIGADLLDHSLLWAIAYMARWRVPGTAPSPTDLSPAAARVLQASQPDQDVSALIQLAHSEDDLVAGAALSNPALSMADLEALWPEMHVGGKATIAALPGLSPYLIRQALADPVLRPIAERNPSVPSHIRTISRML